MKRENWPEMTNRHILFIWSVGYVAYPKVTE